MPSLVDFFSSSDHPQSLGHKFRAKRLQTFESLFFKNFSLDKPVKILDVGGTAYFWKNSQLLIHPNIHITLLNLQLETTSHASLSSMQGDATDMKEFEDCQFDLVFSNSVIEHLYTFENQQKMAAEILRVGKTHFIQTPNLSFPIEAHYALFFAQYMPRSLVFFLLTKTKLSRFQKWDPVDAEQYLDEIRLLNEGEMRVLFPGSSILKEKVGGLTKSLTAHNLD